jgi:hypothetical protein
MTALGHKRRVSHRGLRLDFRYTPFATKIARLCKMSRWATPAFATLFNNGGHA